VTAENDLNKSHFQINFQEQEIS